MTMISSAIVVDRDAVLTSFRRWEAEQAELDAQLAESMEALAAYQSHLDNWQQQLAHERDELLLFRASAEHDRALAGEEHQRLEQTNAELNDARQKIASLTCLLLERTEELRALDHQRGDASTEIAVSRTRERELAAAIAAQQLSFATERQELERELNELRQQTSRVADETSVPRAGPADVSKSGQPVAPAERPRSASPVLGSVIEQFGKLRQQRSMGRTNPKPR